MGSITETRKPLFLADIDRNSDKAKGESVESSSPEVAPSPEASPVVVSETVAPVTQSLEDRIRDQRIRRWSTSYLAIIRSIDYQVRSKDRNSLYAEAEKDLESLEMRRDRYARMFKRVNVPVPELTPLPQIEVLSYTTVDDGKEIKGKLYREVVQK